MDAVYTQLFNAFGLAGCGLYVVSYLFVQLEWIDGNECTYVFLNLTAAVFMLLSLTQAFNLGATVLQIFWIGISLIGLYRKLARNNKPVTL